MTILVNKTCMVVGEQRIYPDHQKEERLDLVEIGGFHSLFWKDADKISYDLQKRYFLAQICISVPLRRGLFVGGVGLIFFTDVIFF